MDILFVAIPIALLVAGIFIAAFLWGVRSGQWDDLDTPAVRMLFEEDVPRKGDPDQEQPKPKA